MSTTRSTPTRIGTIVIIAAMLAISCGTNSAAPADEALNPPTPSAPPTTDTPTSEPPPTDTSEPPPTDTSEPPTTDTPTSEPPTTDPPGNSGNATGPPSFARGPLLDDVIEIERHPHYRDVFGGVVLLPTWWNDQPDPTFAFAIPPGPPDEPGLGGYNYVTVINWMIDEQEVGLEYYVVETTEAEWAERNPPDDNNPSVTLGNGAIAYIGPNFEAECTDEPPHGGWNINALKWLDPSGDFEILIQSDHIVQCNAPVTLDMIVEIANSMVACDGFRQATPACYRSNRPDNN